MLMAGRAPYTMRGELPGSRDAYVHFVQDPFDMASLVRPYVKWEYTLPTGVIAKEALRRAHSVMESDPKGPVYMMLPRETLAEEIDDHHAGGFSEAKYGPVRAGGVEPARAEAIAEALMAAEHPVAITRLSRSQARSRRGARCALARMRHQGRRIQRARSLHAA